MSIAMHTAPSRTAFFAEDSCFASLVLPRSLPLGFLLIGDISHGDLASTRVSLTLPSRCGSRGRMHGDVEVLYVVGRTTARRTGRRWWDEGRRSERRSQRVCRRRHDRRHERRAASGCRGLRGQPARRRFDARRVHRFSRALPPRATRDRHHVGDVGDPHCRVSRDVLFVPASSGERQSVCRQHRRDPELLVEADGHPPRRRQLRRFRRRLHGAGGVRLRAE